MLPLVPMGFRTELKFPCEGHSVSCVGGRDTSIDINSINAMYMGFIK